MDCLNMGITVTRFKFESPNMDNEKIWNSVAPRSKLNYEFGASPRLVGGTTFIKHAFVDHNQVRLLAYAAIQSMEETRNILTKWRRQGLSLGDIYIHRIAEAARHIGVLWASDELDFINCSIAYSRLHRTLLELSSDFMAEGDGENKGLSVLLMTEPGSHHGLGIFMLSEFFRQAGWHVTIVTPHDIADFKRVFLSDWFDAAVLSISTDRQIDTISLALPDLHHQNVNPNLKIYLGGPLAQISPDLMSWGRTRLLNLDASQTVQLISQEVYEQLPEFVEASHSTSSIHKNEKNYYKINY